MFIDAQTTKSKGAFGMSINEINGDQLARDVDAAIQEKGNEGYDLCQSMPITSSLIYSSTYPYTITSGVLLIFKQKNA